MDEVYEKQVLPEDFGKTLAIKLLNELAFESTVDSSM